ncbi:MAG: outer membrane beta-barrel protein [Bacteroidetes bacterium]|nr:outer membrane beta-barrel protein [Bacteroidota bacterium]
MSYKNDNLEELFKEAANDYPLRTDNSNWESVASHLSNVTTGEGINTKEPVATKSNVWKYAALLILLLGGGVIIYLSQSGPNKNSIKSDIAIQQNNGHQNNSIQPSQVINNDKPENISSPANNSADKENPENFKHAQAFHAPSLNFLPKTGNSKLDKNSQDNNSLKDNYSDSREMQTENKNSNPDIQSSIEQKEQNMAENKLNTDDNAVTLSNQEASANTDSQQSPLSQKDVITYKTPLSKFYGSLYGGPQFSMVKLQRISNAGYKVGIALAYRMNKHFDVEIGAQREEINYFTNGKYFDKSGLKIKETTSLEDLTAQSQFTTVPVTVRYNFQSKKNGHFYAGLGVNAMVLTHSEKYQYTTLRNGTSIDKSKNYKSVTSAKYFTSLNANAGYRNKLTNWCDYKIEPYIQIPVKDLGIGKLPITSFGLNVGIVKDLNLK